MADMEADMAEPQTDSIDVELVALQERYIGLFMSEKEFSAAATSFYQRLRKVGTYCRFTNKADSRQYRMFIDKKRYPSTLWTRPVEVLDNEGKWVEEGEKTLEVLWGVPVTVFSKYSNIGKKSGNYQKKEKKKKGAAAAAAAPAAVAALAGAGPEAGTGGGEAGPSQRSGSDRVRNQPKRFDPSPDKPPPKNGAGKKKGGATLSGTEAQANGSTGLADPALNNPERSPDNNTSEVVTVNAGGGTDSGDGATVQPGGAGLGGRQATVGDVEVEPADAEAHFEEVLKLLDGHLTASMREKLQRWLENTDMGGVQTPSNSPRLSTSQYGDTTNTANMNSNSNYCNNRSTTPTTPAMEADDASKWRAAAEAAVQELTDLKAEQLRERRAGQALQVQRAEQARGELQAEQLKARRAELALAGLRAEFDRYKNPCEVGVRVGRAHHQHPGLGTEPPGVNAPTANPQLGPLANGSSAGLGAPVHQGPAPIPLPRSTSTAATSPARIEEGDDVPPDDALVGAVEEPADSGQASVKRSAAALGSLDRPANNEFKQACKELGDSIDMYLEETNADSAKQRLITRIDNLERRPLP